MTFSKVVPSLLFLVPVLMIITAPSMVMAGSDNDDNGNNANIPDLSGQGQIQQQDEDDQEEQPPQCFAAPCPTEPDGGTGGQPQQFPAIPSGRNLAESNQVGGIGSGNVQQRAQGAVNEQYCATVGGIGDRRCQQEATEGADNIQECSAVAGLGKANCVQSEQGGGKGTCLSANGKPYICFTDSGAAVSGSGQAGQ